LIIENKDFGLGEETNFDFKYVPNYSTITELGTYEDSGLAKSGVERRNFRTLIIAGASLAVVLYFWMKVTWRVVGFLKGLLFPG
jgi:hypothetical protein